MTKVKKYFRECRDTKLKKVENLAAPAAINEVQHALRNQHTAATVPGTARPHLEGGQCLLEDMNHDVYETRKIKIK